MTTKTMSPYVANALERFRQVQPRGPWHLPVLGLDGEALEVAQRINLLADRWEQARETARKAQAELDEYRRSGRRAELGQDAPPPDRTSELETARDSARRDADGLLLIQAETLDRYSDTGNLARYLAGIEELLPEANAALSAEMKKAATALRKAHSILSSDQVRQMLADHAWLAAPEPRPARPAPSVMEKSLASLIAEIDALG